MKDEGKTTKRHPIGSPPGTLMPLGEVYSGAVEMHVLSYTEDSVRRQHFADADTLADHLQDPALTWITVTGVHDSSLIESIGRTASIHPLFLEDIMNLMVRPKVEFLDSQMLIIMKTPELGEDSHVLQMHQASIVTGPGYVITFLDRPMDMFEPLVKRIEAKGSTFRRRGPEYLAYAVMDILIDRYYTVIDHLGDKAEELEEEILKGADNTHAVRIHRIRNQLISLRKTVWPIREIIRSIMGEEGRIDPSIRIYYSDIYDHVIQIMDHVETLRDIISGLMDIYMSAVSNRMNEVMKVLTVIATIFIPLTFIAGVYGMNFLHMPELAWRWGYYIVLGIMLAVSVIMIIFFRKRRWI